MRSASFIFVLWVFALGAMVNGVVRSGTDLGTLYIGLGALGVLTGHALMLQHRQIRDLEKRLESKPASGDS